MLRLLKFEGKKQWKPYSMVLVVYFILLVALTLWMKPAFEIKNIVQFGGENGMDFPVEYIWVMVLASSLFGLSVLDAINNIRLELKKNTRNLYFSVPINAYAMIGAKLIFSLLVICATGLISLFSVILSLQYLVNFNIIGFLFENFPPINELIWFGLMCIGSMSNFILLVYLTYAVYRAFFTQFRFGGLITFILFMALSYVYSRIGELATSVAANQLQVFSTAFSVQSVAVSFISAGILFVISGYLLEHRANFD